MSISISPECKLLLYVDDSAILFSHKYPEVISRKLSSELESCSKWLVDNKLSLHLGKSECVLFGSRRKLRKVHNFDIEWNGHTIKAQSTVKYLGVNLDNFLSGETLANCIICKVNLRLKFFYRQCSLLDETTSKSLRATLIPVTLNTLADLRTQGWIKHWRKKKSDFAKQSCSIY